MGFFRKYTFSCPVGTVFDETVSVCNHPWAAPPCEDNTEEEVSLYILRFNMKLTHKMAILRPFLTIFC